MNGDQDMIPVKHHSSTRKHIDIKNIKNEMTNIIFEYVSQGDIETLKANLTKLGYTNYSDIGNLYDEESYRQNALFVSCCIKDDKKAMEMT